MTVTNNRIASEFGSADEQRSPVLLFFVGMAVVVAIYSAMIVTQAIGWWVALTEGMTTRQAPDSAFQPQTALAA